MAITLTIGTDPEIMLEKDGKIVSAIPVFKGDKYDKTDLGDGYSVYYDNVLAETNVPPATDKQEFVDNCRNTLQRIARHIGSDYSLIARASYYFSIQECSHPAAMLAGCHPEFCAYEIKKCYPPQFVDTFRSAGGHIHVGREDYNDIDELECSKHEFLIGKASRVRTIRAMDMYVGLPLLLIDNSEASKLRKRLYGMAGRFRPTSYGVEYRTPSNYWLSKPELAELVYDLTKFVFDAMINENVDLKIAPTVAKAINEDDYEFALDFCKKNLPQNLFEQTMSHVGNSVGTINKEWRL
jgi:hypothetical protein